MYPAFVGGVNWSGKRVRLAMRRRFGFVSSYTVGVDLLKRHSTALQIGIGNTFRSEMDSGLILMTQSRTNEVRLVYSLETFAEQFTRLGDGETFIADRLGHTSTVGRYVVENVSGGNGVDRCPASRQIGVIVLPHPNVPKKGIHFEDSVLTRPWTTHSEFP